MKKLIIILIILIIMHVIFFNLYENIFVITIDTEMAVKQLEDSNYVESKFIAKGGIFKIINYIFYLSELLITIFIVKKLLKRN
jgi:hypothetical protein